MPNLQNENEKTPYGTPKDSIKIDSNKFKKTSKKIQKILL